MDNYTVILSDMDMQIIMLCFAVSSTYVEGLGKPTDDICAKLKARKPYKVQ